MKERSSSDLSDISPVGLAYREIKRRILDRIYEPGQKLSEVRLTADLNLGRSPIRTALGRLRGEDWIEITPQSGTYVKGLSSKEISEIVELRLILEPEVARMAAGRTNLQRLKKLQHRLEEYRAHFKANSQLDVYFDLDLEIHMTIYEAAGNALMSNILIGLLDKVRWIQQGSVGSSARREAVLLELSELLGALERQNAEEAAKLMHNHIRKMAEFRGIAFSE